MILNITNVIEFNHPITFVKNLSTRLRHARTVRGLTQAELAKACRLSQSAISNYETGQRMLPKDMLQLAEALKVNPLWLQRGEGEMDAAAPHATPDFNMKEEAPRAAMPIWPFPNIAPADYWSLEKGQRLQVERAMAALIASFKSG